MKAVFGRTLVADILREGTQRWVILDRWIYVLWIPFRMSPGGTEDGTSHKASSSQQGNNHQLVPSHDDLESPSKSIDANSLISATKSPIDANPGEGANTAHLQMIETSTMDMEKEDTLMIVEATQNHKAIFVPNTKLPKTWKRTGSKLAFRRSPFSLHAVITPAPRHSLYPRRGTTRGDLNGWTEKFSSPRCHAAASPAPRHFSPFTPLPFPRSATPGLHAVATIPRGPSRRHISASRRGRRLRAARFIF
ncbi:acyl-CoA dehydrogenase [Striga asiatica]|uniref:Acyl-CoA dehydrogenase n=1 Tax=Striga asiatica TaxID=4170 RepID=A0A5A7QGN1_STRAF|nr:acyl-CoA dehydrogenase [Striga asiatica]